MTLPWLGNGLTLAAFNAEIAVAQNLLDTYNARIAAVGVKYGKDSSEIDYHPNVPPETPPAGGGN